MAGLAQRWWWCLVVMLGGGCPAEPDPPEGELGAFELAVETQDGALLSVWGRAADDVLAVGGQQASLADAGNALMLHGDGEAWTKVELPADTPLLNWVWGQGGTTWTVGNAGAALRDDGGGWQPQPTGVDAPLWGVWGSAVDDVWAVGGDAFTGPPVLVHFEGDSWHSVDVPPLDREAKALFKVWGTAADDVHAVGDAGVILHFDGTAWTQSPSGTGNDLISLWGTGADDIVAVGGRANGTLARFDGAAWTVQTLGALPGCNGVWVDTSGDAIVVGDRGTIATLSPGSFEFETTKVTGVLPYALHAVFGFDDGTRFAVGGNLLEPPPWRGVLVSRTRESP